MNGNVAFCPSDGDRCEWPVMQGARARSPKDMGDFGYGHFAGDKWVCPNDRQLALRAKLRSGWSVKSSQMHSFSKPTTLSDIEQDAIKSVIERAEKLDKQEQERIGRLVDRLENMKSRAIGNGANQCVLCGEEFGLLGATSYTCADCKKALCTKCGVDTLSVHKEQIWLCKICSETRETWKKSGAWFFKGLPKYVLPERKVEHATFNVRRIYSHPNRTAMNEPNLRTKNPPPVTPHRKVYNTWSKTAVVQEPEVQVTSEEHETESTSEDEGVNLPAPSPSPRQRKGSVDSLSPRVRSTAPSPNYMDHLGPEAGEFDPRLERLSISDGTDKANDAEDDVDQIFSCYKSAKSRGLGGLERLHGPSQEVVDNEDDDEVNYEQISPDETVYGSLHFSLLYDSINHALHCTLIRAKGLRAMDSNGLSDPYVKLHLLPKASKSNKLRSKTIHKTLNPEFNETLTYFGIFEGDMARKTLRLSVLDEDTFGHDFIGEARIPLRQLKPHHTKHFNIYLDRQHPLEKDDDLLTGENNLGKILLSLKYCTQRQGLIVGIIRCSHLPARDSNGYSDPFVKVQLKPDPLKRRFKTAIKWKNLNPEFNEEFTFEVKLQDLAKKILVVAVWDKDYGRTNDYIGGLEICIASKGGRLRHWLEMMKNPDRRHDRWHHLSEEILSE